MNIFKLLEKNQKKRHAFYNSEEYLYFMKHRDALLNNSAFNFLYDADIDDFMVMRANIILYGLENKKIIEKELRSLTKYIGKDQKARFKIALRERLVELPYYSNGKDKIFIPFFSRAINLLLSNQPEELLTYPYTELVDNFDGSIIDAFDTYGSELYNSYFTKLIKVLTNGSETAFYHYDTNTIYIINSQGRLDCKIVLFDKYMDKISTSHMLERIKPAIESYFANNREEFIENLFKNSLISEKMKVMMLEHKN